jgi:hypothetical protein
VGIEYYTEFLRVLDLAEKDDLESVRAIVSELRVHQQCMHQQRTHYKYEHDEDLVARVSELKAALERARCTSKRGLTVRCFRLAPDASPMWAMWETAPEGQGGLEVD